MPKTLLPDVNVWLALAFDGHLHHPPAKRWFEGLTDEVGIFCRLTQQAFLRLASNPSVFGEDALLLVDAWEAYGVLRRDPRVAYAEEPLGLEQTWRAYTQRQTYSPHIWNDAYLAAFAHAGGLELVTFDKGMKQFPSVQCKVLE